jgi:hypothetical protein
MPRVTFIIAKAPQHNILQQEALGRTQNEKTSVAFSPQANYTD